MPSATNTLASAIHRQLREDIATARLLPGTKLRVEALRARYQAGASPIREALNRLISEGLVSQEDQKGFRVTKLSASDLEELTRTRCWINDIAIPDAIAHADAEWEEGIVLAFHRLTRVESNAGLHQGNSTPFDSSKWDSAHLGFHSALISTCRSRWIRNFSEMLFVQAGRYQHLSTRYGATGRNPAAEHKAIMEAVIDRKVDLAVQLANSHILETARIALSVYETRSFDPDEGRLSSQSEQSNSHSLGLGEVTAVDETELERHRGNILAAPRADTK